jgi:hypothetical protein
LLSQSSGNGGNTSSTTSSTNIFSPAAYADYKRFGGEPTVVVDRYALTSGTIRGKTCTAASPCYPDFDYASSPQGFVFPHYSTFFKSSDLGETFRTTAHFPATGLETFSVGGGGDSHIAVGQLTHKVFFSDLPAQCVTMNTSSDFGESFTSDPFGCGFTPGTIDDRNWVAVDELGPTENVYSSFIDFTAITQPTLVSERSIHDGATGSFGTDSTCNPGTLLVGSQPLTAIPGAFQAPDALATPCPDPGDTFLDVAGPPVADIYNTHNVYIPFIRATPQLPGLTSGPPYSLWIAKSTDGGATWTRFEVADVGQHNPVNIFPELTIDRQGNLYYTWSQTQGPSSDESGFIGEQDVFYAFSTSTGTTWSPPVDLTGEANDSAIFPWMVAGDAGNVDLVYYKANSGVNSNVEAEQVWNVYFAQSNNALNTGANFKSVQISAQPNHIGGICTSGLACSGNRDLLDFFTVDVDHLGAANVMWADDNNGRQDTINRFSRQLSGNSVFKNTNINLQSSWPITDHAVTDSSGDVFNASGAPNGSCAGMDVLGTSEKQSNGLVTVTLTLNNAPTESEAEACAPMAPGGGGGIWGAEFWASSSKGNNNFYVAYRDTSTQKGPEAGRVNDLNFTITSLELDRDPTVPATLGGSCFPASGPPPSGTCTVSITADEQALGIKPGAGIYSITGLSLYFFGTAQKPPLLRVEGGNSEQADAATAFDDAGTGTTTR